MYKFMRHEAGFCKVLYRNRRKIYCIQDDGGWGRRKLTFYRCSLDGEPSYEVAMPSPAEFDHYIEP